MIFPYMYDPSISSVIDNMAGYQTFSCILYTLCSVVLGSNFPFRPALNGGRGNYREYEPSITSGLNDDFRPPQSRMDSFAFPYSDNGLDTGYNRYGQTSLPPGVRSFEPYGEPLPPSSFINGPLMGFSPIPPSDEGGFEPRNRRELVQNYPGMARINGVSALRDTPSARYFQLPPSLQRGSRGPLAYNDFPYSDNQFPSGVYDQAGYADSPFGRSLGLRDKRLEGIYR